MSGDIHLIERMSHIKSLDKETALWESGWWMVSPDIAAKLVGGRIFFHKAQIKPSYFGGRITKFRIETEGIFRGRVLFNFIASHEFKGINAGRDGWSMEKKVVFIPVN